MCTDFDQYQDDAIGYCCECDAGIHDDIVNYHCADCGKAICDECAYKMGETLLCEECDSKRTADMDWSELDIATPAPIAERPTTFLLKDDVSIVIEGRSHDED
jgi:predicted RNA-binding Zn-ribbon protein involved in translation (DUF1610 family)